MTEQQKVCWSKVFENLIKSTHPPATKRFVNFLHDKVICAHILIQYLPGDLRQNHSLLLFKVHTQQTIGCHMMKCCIDPVLDASQDNH